MEVDTFSEHLKRNIRQALKQDKVELWRPPYTTDGGGKGERPVELIQKYSMRFNCPEAITEMILENFRDHAVQKLSAREIFQKTGLATITVHWSGDFVTKDKNHSKKEVTLKMMVSELKESLQTDTCQEISELKLIFKGKLLEDGKSLQDQSVTNDSHIMAICLGKTTIEARQKEAEAEQVYEKVENIKKLADILSKRQNAGEGKHRRLYLEINDQNGRPLQLPEFERQSLSKAMTLHELGRRLVDNKSYPEGLLLLLEAQDSFCNCRSEILTGVDNYGVLCLDIVWCYLHLKSMDHLPDAELKLRKCRDCLNKSYGSHLERATSLKGSSSSVSALFVRLNVLEGIISYFRGNYQLARTSLDKAEAEIKSLEVDDAKLSQLMVMGFTTRESRLALRSCSGDVTLAINQITARREEKKRRKEEENRKNKQWKLSRKLGKTKNGNWVNVENYEYLVSMGFSKEMAAKALRHTDNSLDQALEVLQNNPELLTIMDSKDSKGKMNIPDELITQLMNMGFDYELSKRALLQFDCDILRATNELLANNGALPSSSRINEDMAAEDDSEMDSVSEDEAYDEEVDKQIAETMGGFTEEEEDYLDFTFVEEISLISEYRAHLMSIDTPQIG